VSSRFGGMSQRRLEWLLRARGTDLSAWPEAERRDAVALMRRSEGAQLAYADALAGEPMPDADEAALSRMQAVIRRGIAPLPALLRAATFGALLGCVAGGLYLGLSIDQADAASDPFTSAQTVTIASLDP
jgi:hypothetical protein